jgi:CBS domain containing-hemolysin-like protein
VVTIDKESDFSELMAILRQSNYSRIPVYEETFDKVVGIIHSKDLIEHFNKAEGFDWHPIIRPAFFVPESKKIDDLFADFQTRRTHIAIVVDEYGGTSGIVTLEDVLEEIVGEINDEFDEPEDMGYTRVSENIYIFDGRTSLNDVCKILDTDPAFFDDTRESAETIGGLLLVLNGIMPKKNTVLHFKGLSFTIINSSERRIETVKVTLPKVEGATS